MGVPKALLQGVTSDTRCNTCSSQDPCSEKISLTNPLIHSPGLWKYIYIIQPWAPLHNSILLHTFGKILEVNTSSE